MPIYISSPSSPQKIASIATAIVTALGATSCMGY
ncbi:MULTISPECIES: smalltalk protein [unclassified Prevotella]